MLRTKRQETYTVPELTVKDIKDYFAEQDIQINTNDLLRPSLESTVKLLDTLLEFFTNQSFSDILEDFKDNPLATEHEDTFFLVNVHRRMNELLNMIGVYNFSIKLILKPEPKKLIAIPSILVSFSMFRDMKIGIFKDGMKLLQGKNEEIKEINQQINEISFHFNKFSEERDKLAYEVIVLEKEIENILQSGNELEKYIEDSSKKDSESEKEKEFLEDSISNLKLELQNKKQESLNYQNYLISDPEELKRNFDKMVRELESEEMKNQELNKESIFFNKNYEKISQISHNLEVINNLKNEYDSLQMKSNELSGKLSNFLSEIKEKEAIIKSLKLKSDHENKKKESLQEKLRKHKENEYNFSKDLHICTDEVKNEYEKTLEKYNSFKNIKSELEKKKNELEYKIMDSTSKIELETDEIIGLIYKLREVIYQNIREASSLIDE